MQKLQLESILYFSPDCIALKGGEAESVWYTSHKSRKFLTEYLEELGGYFDRIATINDNQSDHQIKRQFSSDWLAEKVVGIWMAFNICLRKDATRWGDSPYQDDMQSYMDAIVNSAVDLHFAGDVNPLRQIAKTAPYYKRLLPQLLPQFKKRNPLHSLEINISKWVTELQGQGLTFEQVAEHVIEVIEARETPEVWEAYLLRKLLAKPTNPKRVSYLRRINQKVKSRAVN